MIPAGTAQLPLEEHQIAFGIALTLRNLMYFVCYFRYFYNYGGRTVKKKILNRKLLYHISLTGVAGARIGMVHINTATAALSIEY